MLDDLFESVGKATAPIRGAVDFLTPDVQPTGEGFSLGSLFSSLGAGVQGVVSEGLPGMFAGATQALDPNSGMAARDRLLIGGMAALGGGMVGRELHSMWRANRTQQLAAPSGFDASRALGEPARPRPGDVQLWRQYPGLDARTASVLSAEGPDDLVDALGVPAEKRVRASAWVLDYEQMVGDAGAAQYDLSRFDLAVRKGLLGGELGQNKKIRDAWRQLLKDPDKLSEKNSQMLLEQIKVFSDALKPVKDPSFSFGLVGEVSQVIMLDSGPRIQVRMPLGWTDGSSVDPTVRAARLKMLNHEALVPGAEERMHRMYLFGMREFGEQLETGQPSKLAEKMEAGPYWYPTGRSDIAKAFGLEDVDSDALERAVAAVSFLSEAEEWKSNIAKAHRVLTKADDAIVDPEFQSWLRHKVFYDAKNEKLGRHEYVGKKPAADHEKEFNRIYQTFLDEGLANATPDQVKKVLRLMGKSETVTDVFRSTTGAKQKNFYLNLYDPSAMYPVTVDRHAYDIFLGIDSGVDKRPIDDTLWRGGDRVYDLIADTYRSVAARLSEDLGRTVPPHEVQAVLWEVWRAQKKTGIQTLDGTITKTKDGWSNNDPFMVPEADGSKNVVYEALNGRGFHTTPDAMRLGDISTIRAGALTVTSSGELNAITQPDGTVGWFADPNLQVASQLNNLWPALLTRDGVASWAPISPAPLRSTETIRAAVRADDGGWGESWMNTDFAPLGGHPLQTGREVVLVELPDGVPVPSIRGAEAVPLGRTVQDRPALSMERLDPDKIDPALFGDPNRSPLVTHRWAAISAALGDEQVDAFKLGSFDTNEAHQKLKAELIRRGYHPIEQQGLYGGDAEPSLLVFGISPREAQSLGEMFNQDSILTNEGFIYGKYVDRNSAVYQGPSGKFGGGIDALFPNGAVGGGLPWQTAGRKKVGNYGEDKEAITQALLDRAPTEEVDPRYLLGTQRGLARDHVQRYIDDPNSPPADPGVGNEMPVIYQAADGRRIIMSGHHRAAAALAAGRPLEARVVRDPNARFEPTDSLEIGIDAEDFRSSTRIGNKEIQWRAGDFGEAGEMNLNEVIGRRTSEQVNRVAYTLPERSSMGIGDLATQLEATGSAKNLSVYTRQSEMPGWDRQREHLYSDGISTYAVRSRSNSLTSPNSGFVWSRNAQGLMADAPTGLGNTQVSPDRVIIGQTMEIHAPGRRLEVGEKPFDVKVDGKQVAKLTIVSGPGEVPVLRPLDPGEPTDGLPMLIEPGEKKVVLRFTEPDMELAPALQVKAALQVAGIDMPIEVVTPEGRFGFQPEKKLARGNDVAIVMPGIQVRKPRIKDSSVPEFESKYGFVLDPQSGRAKMAQEDIDTIASVTEVFIDRGFEDAFRRFRLSYVTLADTSKRFSRKPAERLGAHTYAVTDPKPGGGILLSRFWWAEPGKMRAQLELDHQSGLLARNASPGPDSIIAHEYGHIVERALWFSENHPKANYRFEKELRGSIEKQFGKGRWQTKARAQISTTAEMSTSELVAESFSEVFTGTNPSPLAVHVVAFTTEWLDGALKFRRVTGV